MTTIQIARVTEPIAELLYAGDEGYVVEIDGAYAGDADTLDRARQLARKLGGYDLVADADPDDFGRATWTARTPVTDQTIRALAAEASEAGDESLVADCGDALDGDPAAREHVCEIIAAVAEEALR